ncbi:MAG: sensor histidine kinase, partial [bacterium]
VMHGRFIFKNVRLFKRTMVRLLLYPVVSGGTVKYYMGIGVPLNEVEGFLNMLSLILIVVTPIFIIIASLGGIIIAGRAMKPVDEIINTARRIEAGNLSEQIRIKTKNDEIGKLAETFNEMLQRLNKTFNALTNFSQNVSHELKTPLTIMKSGIEINIKEERSIQEYKELLISLLEEVDQMTRIIDDLLLTSLSDVKAIRDSFTRINVSALLMQTVDFLEALAVDKGILFKHSIQDGIMMIGNERLLKRAFSNLIDNAIKFTPYGKGVFISAVKKDSEVVINIVDQGIGIPEADIPMIFDRFYRGKTSNVKGHGLGLSIVKWIIELHQGNIQVISGSEGTNFKITFTSCNV